MVTAIGLPVFSALDAHQVLGPGLEGVGDAEEGQAALGRGGVPPLGEGPAAAAMARSMSLAPDTGASRYSSPVLGSISMAEVPSVVSTMPAADEVRQPPVRRSPLRLLVAHASSPGWSIGAPRSTFPPAAERRSVTTC